MNKNFVIVIIILIAGIIYGNSLSHSFIWDDTTLIVKNPYIKSARFIGKIFTSDLFSFDYEKGNYYRPLQALTYMFDYSLWRLNPIGYHITNILLHALCAILVYLLILSLSANNALSFITSLLFLVNPIHTEAITYISGRADALAGVFILTSLLLYIKFKTGFNTRVSYALSLLSFIFALLSKEIAVVLPFFIVLYDSYFFLGKRKPKFYVLYFIILGIYAALRMGVLNFSQRPLFYGDSDFLLRMATSVESLLIYIWIALFPFNLHMERVLPLASNILRPEIIFSALLICLIIVLMIKSERKYKLALFGAAWFFLSIIPSLGIFMPGKDIIMAEHWLYLPSIGIFLILGAFLDRLIKISRRTAIVIIIPLLSFYSYRTIKQNITWKDPERFYKRIITYSPNSSKAHFNLGLVYEQKREYDKAIKEYKLVQQINPRYIWVHSNLGNVYSAQGHYDQAMQEYRRCIEIEPNYFLSYNNLGTLYVLKGEYYKAIEEYTRSISLNPYYSPSYNNLGSVYIELGDLERAEEMLGKALSLDPQNTQAHNNLGNLYAKKGLYDKAIIEYKKAVKLDPCFDKAYFNLGVVYYQRGSLNEAKLAWGNALRVNPDHVGALHGLELIE